MKRYSIIALALLLTACGSHTQIETHEVAREELYLRANKPVLGWATWKHEPVSTYGINKVMCDIYLMPISEYESQEQYDEIYAHERRHCYEGNYHPE